MAPKRARRTLVLVVAALGVCVVLALRQTAQMFAAEKIDPMLRDVGFKLDALWSVLYYLTWAALAPLIFSMGRRVRFRLGHWLGPLAFHAATGVIVAVVTPVTLAILFGGLVLHRGYPDPQDLVTPFWTRYAIYRAITDSSIYWLILAAGSVLTAYDEFQARRLQAADLERSLVAAQVDVLKMKLQPHFLFNTLNSIRFLALEKDGSAVVTMVERLANLLRASMAGGSHLVTLEQELALADEYLAIEQVRLGDRLSVERRIDPAVRQAYVPALLLQPIVENSVKHAFSRSLAASRMEIAAFRDGDCLRIAVSDDGPGLPQGWDLAASCGRGLGNVIDRLNALYGNAWSLSLKGGEAGGAIVELAIPYCESSTWATAEVPRAVTGEPAAAGFPSTGLAPERRKAEQHHLDHAQ